MSNTTATVTVGNGKIIPSGSNHDTSTSTKATSGGAAIGVKQLFDDESSTYTYLLWDPESKDAIIVDPVDIQGDRDVQVAAELGLKLVFGVNTHAHADHITGTHVLKTKIPGFASVISKSSTARADHTIEAGDEIVFGSRSVTVRATPGHTSGCVSFVADDESFVLTGDALLIQGCGRTDFQGGSSEHLFDSIHSQLFTLPDSCTVYPCHDYKGRVSSLIGDEKSTNPRLGGTKTKDEFVEIMKNLKLSYPKKMDISNPANMRCGVPEDE